MKSSQKPVQKLGGRQPQQQRQKKKKPSGPRQLAPPQQLAPSGLLRLVQVKTEMALTRSHHQKRSYNIRGHDDEVFLLLGRHNSVGNLRSTSRLKRKSVPAKTIEQCKGREKKPVATGDTNYQDAEGTLSASDDSSEEEGAVKLPVASDDKKSDQDSERKPPAKDDCPFREDSEALDGAISPAVDHMTPEIAEMLASCLDVADSTVLDTKKLDTAIIQLVKIAEVAHTDGTGVVVRDVCSALSPLLASMIPEVISDISTAMREASISWVSSITKKVRSTCRVAIRETLQEEIRAEFRENGIGLPPSPAKHQHHHHHRNCDHRSPARRGLNSRTGPEAAPYSSSASENRPGRRVKPRAKQELRPNYRMTSPASEGLSSRTGPEAAPYSSPASENRPERRVKPRVKQDLRRYYRMTRERSLATATPRGHVAGANSRGEPNMTPQPPNPAFGSSPPPPGYRHGHSGPVWHPPGGSYDQQPRGEEPLYGSRGGEPLYGRGRRSLGQASYQQAPNSRHREPSASQPQPQGSLTYVDYYSPYDDTCARMTRSRR